MKQFITLIDDKLLFLLLLRKCTYVYSLAKNLPELLKLKVSVLVFISFVELGPQLVQLSMGEMCLGLC